MRGKLLTLAAGCALLAGIVVIGTHTQGLLRDACVGLGALVGMALAMFVFLVGVEALCALLPDRERPRASPMRDAHQRSPIVAPGERRPAP